MKDQILQLLKTIKPGLSAEKMEEFSNGLEAIIPVRNSRRGSVKTKAIRIVVAKLPEATVMDIAKTLGIDSREVQAAMGRRVELNDPTEKNFRWNLEALRKSQYQTTTLTTDEMSELIEAVPGAEEYNSILTTNVE